MSNKRVIMYYQTFNGLVSILKPNPYVTHIHLAAIHFGLEHGHPYIHLNNCNPDDEQFTQVWKDMDKAVSLGIKVMLMIGGAGGGYSSLFSNYATYYGMLRDVLKAHPCISGIDMDIEEPVLLNNVKQLISDIKTDFPGYSISMAPLQSSLETDVPGMGGFMYKDLYNSPEGAYIDYFNGQFYQDFSVGAYNNVIDNGYPASKVIMGSINGTGDIDVINTLSDKYKDFGGVFSWEEYSTIPTPAQWAMAMSLIMRPSTSYKIWAILYQIALCSRCILFGEKLI